MSILVISPAVNSDVNNFLKTNPDASSLFQWLSENISPNCIYGSLDADDVLSTDELSKWAVDNGYYSDLDDFDEETIYKYVADNLSPEKVCKLLLEMLE